MNLQHLIEEEIKNLRHRGHKSEQTQKWHDLFANRLEALLLQSDEHENTN